MPKAFNFSVSPFDALTPVQQQQVQDSVDIAYYPEGSVVLEVGAAPSHLWVNIKGHVTAYEGEDLVGIYFTTPEQEAEARTFIEELTREGVFAQPIVTEVRPLTNYHPAEDYHQDFFARNPYQGYCLAVAAPKVAKFRQTFARLVRD